MDKEKRSKRIILYCIPFVIQLVVHIVASGALWQRGIDHILLSVIAAFMITTFSMLIGEGYGSIAFIIAGFHDHIAAYAAVIIFSVIGANINFAGYMITGIEGRQCIWMTAAFWCVDIFLIVFSIIRIVQLSSKKDKIA